VSSSKKVVIGIVALLLAGVALVGVGWLWVENQLAGDPIVAGEPVTYEVRSGSTATSIGQELAELDVVRNAFLFRLVARSRGLDARLAAGQYEMETGMSIDDAIDVLVAGPAPPDTLRITIPEGLTVDQTLVRLANTTDHDLDDFRQVLDAARADRDGGPLEIPEWVPDFDSFDADLEVFEGLLFPQTYEFELGASPTRILQRLLNQTEIAMATVPQSAITAAEEAGVSRYHALIAASLVEREARVPGEWEEIAAVIRNRLDIGMLLQIDATLLYAAGTPDGGPRAVNTEIDSPYNTYQNAGLPPTPISGARPEAIRAVFQPAQHDYLYYVVAPECDGSHRFARTLDEHNANVRAYRDAGRCE